MRKLQVLVLLQSTTKRYQGLPACGNCAWFPLAKEVLRIENLCWIIGFDERLTAILVCGRLLKYAGELYSEEHKRTFTTEKATFQMLKGHTDKTGAQNRQETYCRMVQRAV